MWKSLTVNYLPPSLISEKEIVNDTGVVDDTVTFGSKNKDFWYVADFLREDYAGIWKAAIGGRGGKGIIKATGANL